MQTNWSNNYKYKILRKSLRRKSRCSLRIYRVAVREYKKEIYC